MYPSPSKYPNFVEIERRALKHWKADKSFEKLRAQVKGNPPWSFIDGPITANNPMGVHHAWGRTLKDIFQRFHAMKGYEVRFQNGFDCQGLWVEVEVEKDHGFQTKQDIQVYGIDKFVRDCKARVLTFAAKQTEQSIRLGYWQDWDDPDALRGLAKDLEDGKEETDYIAASGETFTAAPEELIGRLGSPAFGGSYFTLSDENNYTIWTFLKQCHSDGQLDRATDVMPWCPRCETVLSQMEVAEGRSIATHQAVYVRFPIRDRENEAFLIWTTTPWTLPANVAVAINPSMIYLKVKIGDWVYYIGKDNFDHDRRATLEAEGAKHKRALPSLRKLLRGKDKKLEVLDEVAGSDLLGLSYDGPFDHLEPAQKLGGLSPFPLSTGKELKVAEAHTALSWSEVSGGEGTGIVHIAPGCGSEDFQLGLEHDLPLIAPLDSTGHVCPGFDELSGLYVSDASARVIEDLKARGLLVAEEKYDHIYPHCWRCKTELAFRLVDGWKIKMDWRDEIMKIVPDANWIPADGEKRELDWLRNMGDWLISKSRFWGLALPIWECEKPHCDWFDAIGSKEELRERATSGWDAFEGHSPHRPHVDNVKIACEKCGGTAKRVPEVGNPWLDAGIVSMSTLRFNTDKDYWQKWFPADLILESFPGQFRNWFYSLIAMSAKMTGQMPFKNLLGYALVFDERGEEMHKSKGNSIAFDEAAEIVGAEPMRFMYASQATQANLNFPDLRKQEGVSTLFDEIALRKVMTFWNCYKFFMTYAQVEGFKPGDEDVSVDERNVLDRWILSRLQTLTEAAHTGIGGFHVYRFMADLERFNEDLSNWYLRGSRSRFWGGEDIEAKKEARAALSTLYKVLKTEAILFAPVLPFLSEEIYQSLVRPFDERARTSVHLEPYPTVDPALRDADLERAMALAITVKNLGLSLRNKANIRVRQPLSKLFVNAVASWHRDVLSDPMYLNMIKSEINVVDIVPFGDEENLIRPVFKVNFRTLGARLGQAVQAANAAIQALDPQAAHDKMITEGRLTVEVDGEPVELTEDDITISYEQVGSLLVASEGGIVAALETELTDELIAAGLARDVNREIQTLRKELGLEVTQRIRVRYAGTGQVMEAINVHRDSLAKDVLAKEFSVAEDVPGGKLVLIGDSELTISVEPV